jgi:hypothetical protein
LPSRSLTAAVESAYAAVADSGVIAFALASLRAKGGGDGSRTRVLAAIPRRVNSHAHCNR